MSDTTIYRLHLTTISNTGRETRWHRLVELVPSPHAYPIYTETGTIFFDYADALSEPPTCPVCNTPLRQTHRGATLAKRGPAYVCPANEGELVRDEHGHLHMIEGARHAGLRTWTLAELDRWDPCAGCGRPVAVNPAYPPAGAVWCDDCYNASLGGETA